MIKQKLEMFIVIGISVRTTNANAQAGKDIPALWSRFVTEEIAGKFRAKQVMISTAFTATMKRLYQALYDFTWM